MKLYPAHSSGVVAFCCRSFLLLSGCSQPTWSEHEQETEAASEPSAKGGGIPALKETRPTTELAQPTSFVRVDLARGADGKVSLLAVSRADLKLRPIPSLATQYLVAGYLGQEIVAATPIAFSTDTFTGEQGPEQDGGAEDGASSSVATAFLEAASAIDRIAVLAESEEVVLDLRGNDLPAAVRAAGSDAHGKRAQIEY
jgi:hypothetical protein